MQRLTQSKPDNCWQTCVAMLLGCSADVLPDQSVFGNRQEYADALRTYLFKHHDLTYVEIESDKFDAVLPYTRSGHVLIGETERTSTEHDVWHAVVGKNGKFEWDVHPSRAGLTNIKKWGLLVPLSNALREFVRSAGRSCYCSICSSSSTGNEISQ